MDKNDKNRRNIDLTMRQLSKISTVPKSAFVLLLLLYFISNFMVMFAARSKYDVLIFGMAMPFSILTGVFSSFSNIVLIFLVVLFRKKGYITSIILLLLQFPTMVFNIIQTKSPSSIPGAFMNIFTASAISIIYFTLKKINDYQENFRRQAVTDSLTGLPNRFACDEVIKDLAKNESKFAVVSINLYNFKSVNDTMGRETGDKVLIEIGDRWKKLSDSFETETNDFVARIAGDEYLIVIWGYDRDEQINSTVARYKAELERVMTIDGCDYFITGYFGYVEYPSDVESSDTIITYADSAMNEAKRIHNTSNILRFKAEHLKTKQTLEIERKIRSALDNNTIFLHVQPQYDISHKLRGFEALARMKDSDGSFISPGDFIPVAEQAGLIDRVDTAVFKQALDFIERVMDDKKPDIMLSFNVSVRHLMKNNFIEEIKGIVNSHRVPADHLEIEITESIMIDSAEKALNCINELKSLGIKIAIDDFGTGYSSLSYLNNIPADLLKIDKSFIDVMNQTDSNKQYVATIIQIGHILNLEVISEGVESEDQIATLRENGCDFIQGYVWGRPIPVDEAYELVMRT